MPDIYVRRNGGGDVSSELICEPVGSILLKEHSCEDYRVGVGTNCVGITPAVSCHINESLADSQDDGEVAGRCDMPWMRVAVTALPRIARGSHHLSEMSSTLAQRPRMLQ